MAEFHEEGEEGRNVENEITDKEEDMIPKHDRVEPEPLSHLSPQKLVASIGSPIFKTLKRGIHPESRLPYEEEEGEDEEENPWESEAGDDIRAKDELLLRTPQKKRRSQQFDGDHVFLSPGSPGDWLEMQSPRMRRTLNIPESNHEEEEEEGISSPSSPTLKHTAHGRQETPVRKRVYTSNLLEDADPEEVGMSGEEESDPTENNGERKDPSSRTSKRHTPGSMNLDLSNLAMLPPTMSARAWSSSNSSSNNSITPTSSRSVVYDVFQTPPPKSRPVPSPDMKPPPAPSFSPFKAHPMFFNDRSDRDSPVRQKSIRLQKLGTKQPFKTSNSGGSYFDGLDK
ncbi:hypothetical protein BGZ83_008030 [Gryganskiella cystojenkinii]|nr:hypothetical protein BGZ83_008030 [Gryganskiella cystojenkinii]